MSLATYRRLLIFLPAWARSQMFSALPEAIQRRAWRRLSRTIAQSRMRQLPGERWPGEFLDVRDL